MFSFLGLKISKGPEELIGKTAKLEFKIVNDETPLSTMNDWVARGEEAGIVFKKGERFSAYVEKLNKFIKARPSRRL